MTVSGAAPQPLTAPQLYALSQEKPCTGTDRCHWCGAPCGRLNRHDEPAAPIDRRLKYRSTAKVPSSAWVCNGCWLFRRQSTTVFYLDRKTFMDRQAPQRHSWLIDERGAVALRKEDATEVYRYLLHPPARKTWSLSLVTSGTANNLHQGATNYTISGYTAASPLGFTLNNIPHTYSVQELELAARTGQVNGKEPGVRALFDHFGPPASGLVQPEQKPKTGRPEEEAGQQQRRRVG